MAKRATTRGSRKKTKTGKHAGTLDTASVLAKLKDFLAILASHDDARIREYGRATIRRLALDEIPSSLGLAEKLEFGFGCLSSHFPLPGYATLDEKHIAEIAEMIERIELYVDDASQMRPLNFLMLASPGAGKSHFVDCVAERTKAKRAAAISFNMGSMTASEDLIKPLDEARNAKVEDRIPLLFLDEFDASPANYSLLLPLLWDGRITLGTRDLKLGKLIIVLAGSSPLLPEALVHAKAMRSSIPLADEKSHKLVDLFSRINGTVIRIPPFTDPSKGIDRRMDKVVIASQLLQRRFPNLIGAPLALFRFIANVNFRYGVRSITHLIDLIPRQDDKVVKLEDLALPIASVDALRSSSLAYHLIDEENQAHGVVAAWEAASRYTDRVVVGSHIPELVVKSINDKANREFLAEMLVNKVWTQVLPLDRL